MQTKPRLRMQWGKWCCHGCGWYVTGHDTWREAFIDWSGLIEEWGSNVAD